jgi:thermostable 8-oxoguanine DNA glycosylase
VSKNYVGFVERITAKAFACQNENERIHLLTALKGVAVPTASCILSWSAPQQYGVIDRLAWKTLRRRGLVHGATNGQNLRPKHWINYHTIVTCLASALNRDPRNIDLWLWNASRTPHRRVRPSDCH